MDKTPFLSVILPTYNRRYCIEKMIDSVLMQSFKDFELIVIDDGSTDMTIEILEKTYHDDRIRLVRKEKGGVSSARNAGISLAKGEWITFVDSDDYLLDGFFEDIYHNLAENNYEILVYGGYSINEGEEELKEVPLFWYNQEYGQEKKIVKNGKEFLRDFCLLSGNSWGCAKVFKSSMIKKNHIYFDENIDYGEDMLFDIQAYFVSLSVMTSPKKFYIYNVRNTALFWNKDNAKKNFDNLVLTYERLKKGGYEGFRPYLALNCVRHLRAWIPRNLLDFQKVKSKLEKIYCEIDEDILSDRRERLEIMLIKKNTTALYVLPMLYSIYSKAYFFVYPLIFPILRMIRRGSKK